MRAISHYLFRHAIAILALGMLCSRADIWMPAMEFHVHSENKKFFGQIIPATNKTTPTLTVYRRGGIRRWRAELCNAVAPTKAWISNDGESVVTADNWGKEGYGDDVIAIYGRKGLLAKYSLEQVAPLPRVKPGDPGWRLHSFGYYQKIPHSTSSRQWRQNSIEFFHETDGQLLFCIWLGWDNKWVAWKMSDGSMLEVTSDQAREFDTKGRTRALERSKSTRFDRGAMEFLGHSKVEPDRARIESWLRDTEFHGGFTKVIAGDPSGEGRDHGYFAESAKREIADRLLAEWDGRATRTEEWPYTYRYLGTLECTVSVPMPLVGQEGSMRLYLIPAKGRLKNWAAKQPDHYLIANLRSFHSSDTAKPSESSHEVKLSLFGITPGEYLAKVVWDKSAPFARPDSIIYRPGKGDYESVESPVITIQKGVVVKGVSLDCRSRVGK